MKYTFAALSILAITACTPAGDMSISQRQSAFHPDRERKERTAPVKPVVRKAALSADAGQSGTAKARKGATVTIFEPIPTKRSGATVTIYEPIPTKRKGATVTIYEPIPNYKAKPLRR